MRLSISLIYTLFFLLLGLICAWAVYTSAVPRPDRVTESKGDRYPTSIAVLDTLHREAFLALQGNGLQETAWVERVDWAPLGGHVTIATSTDDALVADRIRKAVGAHPGIEEVTVRPVTDLKAQAEAALDRDNLQKYAFIEAMKGRIPMIRLARDNKETVAAVRNALSRVSGVLAARIQTGQVGDLLKAATAALEKARLDRYAMVDRADGRVLFLRVTGDDKAREQQAVKVVEAVPGVLSVDLTRVPLTGDAKVTNLGGCQVLFRAIKGRWRVVFARGTATIQKESEPLLDRLAAAANRCAGFTIQVIGPGVDRREARGVRRLSGNRANAVVDYFVNKGVARRVLRARAFNPENVTGRPEDHHMQFIVKQSAAAGGAK